MRTNYEELGLSQTYSLDYWGSNSTASPYQPYSIYGGGTISLLTCNAANPADNVTDNLSYCSFHNVAISDPSTCPVPYIFSNPTGLIMQESPFNANPTLRSIASILFDMQQTSDELELIALQNELFEVMLADGDDTDMIAYLENLNSDEGLMKLVAVYVGKEMGNDALAKLQLLTDIYNDINRTAFKEFYQVLIDLLLQNRTLAEMTVAEKDLIESITYLNVKTSGDAYNIIKMVDETPYVIPCEKLSACDDDSLLTGRKATAINHYQAFLEAAQKVKAERNVNNSNGISTVLKQFGTGLSIAPNPAYEFTNITANPSKNCKHAYILLTDITGKVLQRIALQPDKVNYNIETDAFAKGFYHVCLIEDGLQTDCKKLIIN